MIDLGFEQKRRIGFDFVMEQISPSSPYGREALRQLRPACPGEEESLRREFQNIAKTLAAMPAAERAYNKLAQMLMQIKDIRASLSRIGEELSEVDLFEIKQFLLQLTGILPLFGEINAAADYNDIAFGDTLSALELLDPEGNHVASFFISGRYFPLLAAVRQEKLDVERQIRSLPQGEEKNALLAQRSTLAAREQRQEDIARTWLSKKLKPWRETLLQNIDAIGQLDLTIQKAKLAADFGGCMPTIGQGAIRFDGMTNPQIAATLAESGGAFTALSLELATGATVITGANMGGKSVALKTLALNVLLIHCGFYPFARQAKCPLLDSIFLVSEDLESADRGLSSFGGEIVRLQEVLDGIGNGRALVLLDEFAKGTNPAEGGAIARGVCAHLNARNAYTVMTTHYEGVAALAGAHYQVAGLRRMDADALLHELADTPIDERVATIARYMDYGLLRVCAGEGLPMDAFNICRMLGLSDEIMNLIKTYQ